MTFPVLHISIAINQPADAVYAYVSDLKNLPQWAAGLSGSIEESSGEWIADFPMGKIKIRFAERNTLGVLDHDVTLPSGEIFANPMRVIPNADGSELLFTLFRRPEMTDEAFEADAKQIEADLLKLKGILEQ